MVAKGELCPVSEVADRLYRCKTKIKRMREMKRKGIGFQRVEKFLEDLNGQKKVCNRQGFRETNIVRNIMDLKIRDERLLHNNLKTRYRDLISSGVHKPGSRKHKREKRHLNWVKYNAKNTTNIKYDWKIRKLEERFRTEERRTVREEYIPKWREKLPNLEIYAEMDGRIPTPQPEEEPPL